MTSPRPTPPTLYGTQCELRGVTEEDLPTILSILKMPQIEQWWGKYDEEKCRNDFLTRPETVVYSIVVDGDVVGSIQYFEEPAPKYRHAGLDVFVSTSHQGQGIGSDAVRTLSRHLIHDRNHHRLVIDPQADNIAAIRCYERVGFRRVGLMRQYERDPNGEWKNCLMLEALADDLL